MGKTAIMAVVHDAATVCLLRATLLLNQSFDLEPELKQLYDKLINCYHKGTTALLTERERAFVDVSKGLIQKCS